MKHLDLFSGYGGFTIPASRYGIETINFSEIDKYATAVLKYRFPSIKNLGDITKIKPEDLPDVDIITGGSPCQDLSVAGKGAGLDGGRSGLFFCFINLIKEKQPMYFVWENVKGALSSSKGWDFARVQIEMEQAGYDVFWQVINAKDFGVPQNRERIFAIGVRKGSGREILFEQISSGQNTKTNRKVKSARKFGSSGSFHNPGGDVDKRKYNLKDESGTLSSNPTSDNLPMVAVDITRRAKTGYKLRKENNVGTITSTYYKGIGNAERPGVIVHNLQPRSPNRPSLLKNKNAGGSGHLQREDGVTYTVDTGCSQGVAIRVQGDFPRKVYTSDKVGALASNPTSDNTPRVMEDMRIRRLTPTECERLMGLEDGWTAKGIIDGKEVDISDTQRYKMCGNGVVVNCVDYIYSLIEQISNMEKIEEFIDKLEDNIRWWRRAMETDGFESDEEGSYRRDLENTKKELFNLISDELDKAREEVLLELLEKKTNYKIEEVGHGYKVTQEYVLVSDIEKELSKLSNK